MLPLPIVQVARGQEARRGREDTDAAQTDGCQRRSEAQIRTLPPILYRQGASPLHEGENPVLLPRVRRTAAAAQNSPLHRKTAALNSQKRKSDSAET